MLKVVYPLTYIVWRLVPVYIAVGVTLALIGALPRNRRTPATSDNRLGRKHELRWRWFSAPPRFATRSTRS